MNPYLKGLLAVFSWGFAPILLKYFLSGIDIFLLCAFILFFAGVPFLFMRSAKDLLKDRYFLIQSGIVSILTIIHYAGNFYGILFGNIIVTTLIIKNSPFFQSIIYSILYRKPFLWYYYITAIMLISGVSLATYSGNGGTINLLFIIIPLISSLAWSYLMIYISKVEREQEVLSFANLLSSGGIVILLFVLGSMNIGTFREISSLQYGILFVLGVIPTLIGPILWARSIRELGNKIIFLDYITPVITILGSLLVFNLQLNAYNYIGIVVIFIALLVHSYLSRNK